MDNFLMLRYAPSGSRRMRAFTLIELVVVIVLIGIVSAVAIPRFAASAVRYRVDSATHLFLADFGFVSNRAESKSQTRSITFKGLQDSYILVGERDPANPLIDRAIDLSRSPYEVNMLGASFGGDTQLDISGYGLPLESGQVTFAAGLLARRVSITAGSPTVTIEKINLASPVTGESISIGSVEGTTTNSSGTYGGTL